ncbi:GT2 family glycosyltransferase [Sphingobacterium zeae]|uniref:GT2 family glycosyltransferase n=1 Tax=Sphingobacterium zeae TaxID=1776859 RepID=A0ABU0U8H1_9SPHI|nr:galactosyltransferase-related protein [Sphingobacterium zeae]MDQ1151259.1 GT2 family glycosyltransferase [Sphingobacterium zeae]
MYSTAPVSVLTIVHKRHHALINLVNGLAKNSILPVEIVIVFINERAYRFEDDEYPFRINTVEIETEGHLNLGEARNMAIKSSSSSFNIFLDVDCIPAQNLIEQYLPYSNKKNALLSGRVRYLKKGFADKPDWMSQLMENSRPDPVRNELDQFSYELFWSLNFGCSKETFNKIGGFDQNYIGYGAEDTDFGFSARKNSIAHITIDALAYHQYHPSYNPPLNHFKSIVTNATQFFQKWGVWPMMGWLNKFNESGLIIFKNNQIIILREPSKQEIVASLTE